MKTSPFQARAETRSLRRLTLALASSHLAFAALTTGVRAEHVVLDAALAVLPWLGAGAALFARLALPLWFTGVIVDNQRLWLPLRGVVHTDGLWKLDAALFPAPGGVPWPAYFAEAHGPVLDLLAGGGYATYLFEYFGIALLFFFRGDAQRFSRFAWAFLAVNVTGLVLYMVVPAAPPWYLLQHGPGPADLSAAGSAAGAARFDELLGIQYFAGFYARNPNVFGAMPSLHVAYPLIACVLTWDLGRRWRIGTGAFTALIAFAAIYLTHHYVLDVIAGSAVALATGLVVTGASRIELAGPIPAGTERAEGNA